ncbi:hypothetical protein CONPUDRAFT_154374 [Coniophora puteana RWD-64-598 SS2]|uniref:RING-type domain-containing protein n=1 Tax=Coniophora puteana (strain RWD-64-598) TaxID=741705 RepID=A0A5M3MMD2_CONPW|nr:uncharacterized protein CONPUDRAFT_154374 [Coniophora puteana RWD-64-598 SS2]EIW80339.1 hypothetical protein CONPUDRAFT_154374 [Coniophora puteana RWD-64-598 SS2]
MLASDDFVLTDYCYVFAKVYELIDFRWVDQGTAYFHGQFIEETNQAFLIAREEEEDERTILSTGSRYKDVYQRQQDTLIIWTEPDSVDYALNFQDAESCAEVWNFIIEVQYHINSSEAGGFDSSSPNHDATMTAIILRTGHLPMPDHESGNVADIERSIKALARGHVKEKICDYIQRRLMQTILILNDYGMYEHILDDDNFFAVVGMLEYDPEFPTHKTNYREFLHLTSRFHQPIPIPDESIQKKVHNTYRLQLLKDVVLACALDDSTFNNVLNSCIIFNQIDNVQNDPVFMREIASLYVNAEVLGSVHGNGSAKPASKSVGASAAWASSSPDVTGSPTPAPRRRHHQTPIPGRAATATAAAEAKTNVNTAEANLVKISTAREVLSAVLDHNLIGVRNHVLKQPDALRTLLEISVGNGPETLVAMGAKLLARPKDDPATEIDSPPPLLLQLYPLPYPVTKRTPLSRMIKFSSKLTSDEESSTLHVLKETRDGPRCVSGQASDSGNTIAKLQEENRLLKAQIQDMNANLSSFANQALDLEDVTSRIQEENRMLNAQIQDMNTRFSSSVIISRNDLDELVSCKVCTIKMQSPYLLPDCGHTLCQSCLVNWFDIILAQFTASHPQYNPNDSHALNTHDRPLPTASSYATMPEEVVAFLRHPQIMHHPVFALSMAARQFLDCHEQERGQQRHNQGGQGGNGNVGNNNGGAGPVQPRYTCPFCRTALHSRPVEEFFLKEVIDKLLNIAGEEEEPLTRSAALRNLFGTYIP